MVIIKFFLAVVIFLLGAAFIFSPAVSFYAPGGLIACGILFWLSASLGIAELLCRLIVLALQEPKKP